jgi:hypothetical protein
MANRMAKRTSPKARRTRRIEVANALDKHERIRHNSPDPTELQRAKSELGRAVEESLNDEAVTEYLEEEKG